MGVLCLSPPLKCGRRGRILTLTCIIIAHIWKISQWLLSIKPKFSITCVLEYACHHWELGPTYARVQYVSLVLRILLWRAKLNTKCASNDSCAQWVITNTLTHLCEKSIPNLTQDKPPPQRQLHSCRTMTTISHARRIPWRNSSRAACRYSVLKYYRTRSVGSVLFHNSRGVAPVSLLK